jgi:RecJ-like exonuclease
MDKPSLGVAICMGDRGLALQESTNVLEEYRRTIMKHLTWLMEPETDRIEELSNIYVVRGESVVHEKMIGTISSVLSTSLPKLKKPIIAYSLVPKEKLAKISARALDLLTNKGLNLGEILRIAAEKYAGRGGGHDVAAGAQVPIENLEDFLKFINELVKKQQEATPIGS